jgi:hypothetical protein
MKIYRWLIICLFASPAWSALAQGYDFKVLVSKGKTEVKAGDAWASIKVGANLSAADEIKIAENAYLGLMHASGQPVEIKEPGPHKLADVASKISKTSSVMSKYTDFILSSEDEKRNKLAATGAVHRDLKAPVQLYMPKTSFHMGNEVYLSWNSPGTATEAEIVVTNLAEDELARYKVQGNSYRLNLADKKLAKEANLLIKVITADGHQSSNVSIKRLKGSKKDEVEKAWNEFMATVSNGTALEKFLQAGFFESHMLLSDALTAYHEAMEMAPDVELYKEEYNKFLQRLGLVKTE